LTVCGDDCWIVNFHLSSYPSARYVGFYKIDEPALLIRDLELVKDILVTKFNTFNKNDFAADAEVSREIIYMNFKVEFLAIRSLTRCFL
jgi:hypothetical protein